MVIARPSRPCRAAGCTALATPGRTHCDQHTRATNQQHNQARASTYHSLEYRKQRTRFLTAYPDCFLDLAPTPCRGPLTIHHLNHDATDQRWENFATACRHHHMQLEREHQAGNVDGPLHAALARALKHLHTPGF